MNEKNVRHIDSQVDIYYGNEETSEIKEIKANQLGTPTKLSDLHRSFSDWGHKPFTLEGSFTLDESRAIIDKYGWWGEVLSSNVAESNNVFLFPAEQNPCLFIEFASARIIRKIDVFGDQSIDEYPSRFKLTMYDDDRQKVFCKTFDNNLAHAQVLLQADGTYLADGNGHLIRVRWIKIKIIAWNKPGRLCKIYRFYDDIMEMYSHDDVKEFEVIHEKVNNGAIKFGLCSDSCNVTLYNKDRKFDRGYLKNMVHLNKMIVPHVSQKRLGHDVSQKRLGHFYIKEWGFSQDGMFIKCSANDRLLDFQNIIYPGRMPFRSTDVVDTSKWDEEDTASLVLEKQTQKITFYQLFKEVIEYVAGSTYIKRFDYKIDLKLKDYQVTPYVRKNSVWTVLQKLCDATLSHVYITEDDVLVVETELLGTAHQFATRSKQRAAYNIVAPMEADDGMLPVQPRVAEDENKQIEINTSNAFAMDIPYVADMVANEVSIGYFTKTVADAHEPIKYFTLQKEGDVSFIQEITLNPGETFNGIITMDDIYDAVEINHSESETSNCMTYLNYNHGTNYKLLLKNLAEYSLVIKEIVLNGKKLDFTKVDLAPDVTISNPFAFRYPYAHPDSELIQTQVFAEELRQRIKTKYPEDTKTSTVQWRGDLGLNLNKQFLLKNRFAEVDNYQCTYNKISIQGGMRQEVKGILIK